MDAFDKYPCLLQPGFVEEFDFETCWTAQNDKGISDFDLIVALIRYDANYSQVGRVLGRSRREVERCISADMVVYDLAKDVEESFLDEVESTYRTMAKSGDANAIKFFLSTKGKARGYTVRNEMSGPDGGPIQTEATVSDDLRQALDAIAGKITSGTGAGEMASDSEADANNPAG